MNRRGRAYAVVRRTRSGVAQRFRRIEKPNASAFICSGSRVARDVTLGDHDWRVVGTPIQFTPRPEQHATDIGVDVWVGRRVVIMRGVSIGDGAVVAAGSVVTKPVPSGEVWAGVPARLLGARFDSDADLKEHLEAVRGLNVRATFADPLGSLQ